MGTLVRSVIAASTVGSAHPADERDRCETRQIEFSAIGGSHVLGCGLGWHIACLHVVEGTLDKRTPTDHNLN